MVLLFEGPRARAGYERREGGGVTLNCFRPAKGRNSTCLCAFLESQSEATEMALVYGHSWLCDLKNSHTQRLFVFFIRRSEGQKGVRDGGKGGQGASHPTAQTSRRQIC